MNKLKHSATAELILKTVLFGSEDKSSKHLVSSDARHLSREIAYHVIRYPEVFLFAIKNRFIRWSIRLFEKILNKGFILHVISRKNYIEKLVLEELRKGYTQIVIIGAGYDTLGMRLARTHRDITCFEIDHPSTQILKENALKSHLSSNFTFISADLSETSLTEVLQHNANFDVTKKTVVIIEGVLMYLTEHNVTRLLNELFHLFKTLDLIFTFMDKKPDGTIKFTSAHPAVIWWLDRVQERFLWGIAKDEIFLKMNAIGFSNISVFDRTAFIAEFFKNTEPLPILAEGEMICRACK
ncbi:class I SAM-dependent methyltransferase [Legionella sainthelensi]|uniref:S-adenosyl-L-methionine-dependent methyltransferase n=1 Tax=Legionella sainthelensi TaxID=28087 RepID=A0A2H5FHV7_9GAMM|nr:class I SAM-dependent methyltransferase [Legionella sainthelensi]AUH71093.1 SAM-dependent methyltransferase [Legionella sainthelensi]